MGAATNAFLEIDETFTARAAPRLGCELCYIPAGPFLLGATEDPADSATRFDAPEHPVTLANYAIGRFPVTNELYARFLAAGGYTTLAWWSAAGWAARQESGWSAPIQHGQRGWDHPAQPVVGVHWYEAEAYCRWLSYTSGLEVALPSEAEWEKAARGTDGRPYPWGNEPPTPTRCTHQLPWSSGRPSPIGRCSPEGDSPYGCADMAGNVMEWTCSPFRAYPFRLEPRETTGSVVARGGAWSYPATGVRCSRRYGFNDRVERDRDGQIIRATHLGFRIVLRPPTAASCARAFLRERVGDWDHDLLVNQIELYAHMDPRALETGTRALETLLREPGQDALLYALVVQDAAWPLDPATPTAARRWIEWLTQLCRRELAEHGEFPRRA